MEEVHLLVVASMACSPIADSTERSHKRLRNDQRTRGQERPYHSDSTASRLLSEVKHCRASANLEAEESDMCCASCEILRGDPAASLKLMTSN
eukprot:scaffold20227_cov189-Skeletonema_dohrnii-CCMP3373.AAC.1